MPRHDSSSTLSYWSKAPSYIALTPQLLQQHDFIQASSYRDVEVKCLQVGQGRRIEGAFDSLGVHLEDTIHEKLCQEPVGMVPIENFQASTTVPFHVPAYKSQWPALNGAASCQPPSQEYTNSTSYIFLNKDKKYSPSHYGDAVILAPWRQYTSSGFHVAHDYPDWGRDLAGVGAQFNFHSDSVYTASPYADDSTFEN